MKYQQLPHKSYEKELKEIVKLILNIPSDQYKIRYSEGSSKGDNYIGEIYRAEIIQDDSVKLSIIVKLPPNNISRREEFFLHRSFINEADFYEKLYPLYKLFQENRGIWDQKNGFFHIPHCYKSLTDEPYEGLYFEDLKCTKFEIFDRTKILSKDHVFLVMETLAKMHGVFYCIKEHDPSLIEFYRKRKDYFIMRCERKGSLMKPWFENSKNQALEVINKCGDDELIQKVKAILNQDITELLKNCLNLELTEPYATLCHGDCWNNNIMYRHDKNGRPIDIRFLDFQIMRYASPICDLMYYIFSCTTKALRDKHYHDFLYIYYDTLSRFIKRLGFDSNKIFPRNVFNEHLKRFGKFALIMGTLVLPVFTSDADDVLDMDEFVSKYNEQNEAHIEKEANELSYVTSKTYQIYADRIMGVCKDLYDLGYI